MRQMTWLPGLSVVGFTVAWGLLAWAEWTCITLPTVRGMPGGVLFAPHRIVLFVVSVGLAVLVPILPLGIRWWWRVGAAMVPASYGAWRLLG